MAVLFSVGAARREQHSLQLQLGPDNSSGLDVNPVAADRGHVAVAEPAHERRPADFLELDDPDGFAGGRVALAQRVLKRTLHLGLQKDEREDWRKPRDKRDVTDAIFVAFFVNDTAG